MPTQQKSANHILRIFAARDTEPGGLMVYSSLENVFVNHDDAWTVQDFEEGFDYLVHKRWASRRDNTFVKLTNDGFTEMKRTNLQSTGPLPREQDGCDGSPTGQLQAEQSDH